MQPTTLKIPDDLKKRVAALAQREGKSVHAYLLEAIERHANLSQNRREFIEQALRSRAEFDRTGLAYDGQEVVAYFRARAAGKKARRPKLRKWRK